MSLTWLHISDLHACNPKHGWDAARVTRTLVDDLKVLQAKHGLRPDLIFFTGDAAFGNLGKDKGQSLREQFDEFAVFLDQVRAAFEPAVLKSNVFIVPGNHDVDREEIDPAQTAWLKSQQSLDAVVTLIHEGKVGWRRYLERLREYRQALERHGYQHLLRQPEGFAERLIYAESRDFDSVRVGIAGFNSAWSCAGDGERGQLWMAGKWQQGQLVGKLPDADVRIALIHHPPAWIHEHEMPQFGRGLRQDFHFLLHGHEHQDWVEDHNRGKYHVIATGACYERSDRPNGYNLVQLDPARGTGKVWLRTFEASGGGWVQRLVKDHTDEFGRWSLSLPWLCGKAVSVAAQEEPPAEPPAQPVPQQVLERYLACLREAHGWLQLAGFVTRLRLELNVDEVYVPLRARVQHSLAERDAKLVGAHRELAAELAETERQVPFDQAIQLAHRHRLRGVVVLGDPGSGKTTLLKHFVELATRPSGAVVLGLPKETVPVLIELRRLDDPTAGLRLALKEAVSRCDASLETEAEAERFVQSLCKAGKLLVLVDGLDEVANVEQRTAVSRWLEEAIRKLPHATFVVTSRYAGYRADVRLGGRFLELHVEALEPEDAQRFIGAWYRAVEKRVELGRSEELAERLAREATADLGKRLFETDDRRTESLRRLATNPLMLQILCLVHRDRKQLPERRVELYDECVRVLLESWRGAKGMPIDLPARQAMTLLQPLAWYLHNRGKRDAPLEEILPQLAEPLRRLGRDAGDGARLLEGIKDQSGVLVSLGQREYGFLHLSFQEYLAARHLQGRLAEEPSLLASLAEHFGEPWWREVTLLCLGLDNPPLFNPVLKVLLQAGVLPRDPLLADDCLRDAHETSARPFLEVLASGEGGADARYHALRPLRSLTGWAEEKLAGGVKGRAVVRVLFESREESVAIRRLAGELLGEVGERVVVAEAAGRERVHEPSGMVLVYVPGGEYVLGADDLIHPYTKEIDEASKPEHKMQLRPYWIGKYPVTNEQYSRFLAANPRQKKPQHWGNKQFNQGEQPVVGVDWKEAQAFCAWAGLALPSEAQWESAARGPEGRKYPWGDARPTAQLANFDGTVGRTTPVDAYPAGAGPFGTLDQGGNVWEWCVDVWDAEAYQERQGRIVFDPIGKQGDAASRVVRGGSWLDPAGFLQAAYRRRSGPGLRLPGLGFRCSSPFRPEP